MTDNEIINLISSVLKKLWPKWDLNTEQLRPWRTVLRPIDYYAAQKAAEEHFISPEGGYGRPKLNAIIELARKYQPKKEVVKVETADYSPSVFVVCIEHKDRPNYEWAFYKPVIVKPSMRENEQTLMNAAETMREKLQNQYGGRWIVIQQSSYSQMQQSMIDHRRKAKPHYASIIEQPVVSNIEPMLEKLKENKLELSELKEALVCVS